MDSARPAASARRAMALIAIVLAGCTAAAPEPSSDATLRDLAGEQKRTNEILQRIEARLVTRDETSVPVGASPLSVKEPSTIPSGAEIGHALEPLRDELRKLVDRLDRTISVPSGSARPKQDAEVMQSAARYLTDPKGEEVRHFLWTTRQVLAVYGKPDYVNNDSVGRQSWTYEAEAGVSLVFDFFEGEVLRSYVSR